MTRAASNDAHMLNANVGRLDHRQLARASYFGNTERLRLVMHKMATGRKGGGRGAFRMAWGAWRGWGLHMLQQRLQHACGVGTEPGVGDSRLSEDGRTNAGLGRELTSHVLLHCGLWHLQASPWWWPPSAAASPSARAARGRGRT